MGFIYSPIKLIELFKTRDFFTKDHTACKTAEWYLSKEGEAVYNNLKTPTEKTKYFYDYLMVCPKTSHTHGIVIRTAYIMAHYVAGSSLAFAGYPDILDPNKNPLIDAWLDTEEDDSDLIMDLDLIVERGLSMLAKLNNENDIKKYLTPENKPYTLLMQLNSDGSMSDKYKLERAIIGAFCTEYTAPYMPPYTYDIFHLTDDLASSENVTEEND